ncbi:hypothetical protein COCVIDRAFT_87930 [Bipolaris victoriae FI3]|uniref:Uncharacterized protein n=2 Tax=Bipolaris TaxID=33194 RepID=W6YPQ7_COCC2|nr:uncharacterized protein COCCADRAFT_85341 [Bipolaris zeicola 26-R-13]XP_014561015.1 hypothetical protein COCVIDRAFT_87930 [Bipolaris victoriae FI3]EUC37494.1 hypothetical protein COCCADRAFT_85341 [Bipolaris zeicola 26-R-13]
MVIWASLGGINLVLYPPKTPQFAFSISHRFLYSIALSKGKRVSKPVLHYYPYECSCTRYQT